MVGPAVIGGDMDCGDLMAALRLDGVYECIAVWSKPVVRSQYEKGRLGKTSGGVFHAKGFGVGAVLVGHALSSNPGQAFHVVCHIRHQAVLGLLAEPAHVSSRN